MTTTFHKPKTRLFRSILYLNGPDVINALSGLEGGDVDEVLVRRASEGGSDLGGELDLKAAKGRAARKRANRLEEELRRRRTEQSALSALLKRLHDEEAIGVVDGDYDASVYSELEEQMLVELTAPIRIHPWHQVVSVMRSWATAAKAYGVDPGELRELREAATMLETILEGGAQLVVFADSPAATLGYRIVVPMLSQHAVNSLDEFTGRATFIGQVERILDSDERLPIVRVIKNAPLIPRERATLVEAMPELVDIVETLGVDATIDEFILQKPTVVLKPIAIYK